MPSKSKSQRRLMGWALACKMGKSKNCPENIDKIAKSMKEEDIKDFAKTKHKSLPDKKKNENIMNFYSFIKENYIS